MLSWFKGKKKPEPENEKDFLERTVKNVSSAIFQGDFAFVKAEIEKNPMVLVTRGTVPNTTHRFSPCEIILKSGSKEMRDFLTDPPFSLPSDVLSHMAEQMTAFQRNESTSINKNQLMKTELFAGQEKGNRNYTSGDYVYDSRGKIVFDPFAGAKAKLSEDKKNLFKLS